MSAWVMVDGPHNDDYSWLFPHRPLMFLAADPE